MLFKITLATDIQTTFGQNRTTDVLYNRNTSSSEILYSVLEKITFYFQTTNISGNKLALWS